MEATLTDREKARALFDFMYSGNPKGTFAAKAAQLGLSIREARKLFYWYEDLDLIAA